MMRMQSMKIKMKTERYTLYMNDEYNIRLLDTEEIKSIYNEHIVTDFPASEVKPLKQMLEKERMGNILSMACLRAIQMMMEHLRRSFRVMHTL